jgi:hypothetical protein
LGELYYDGDWHPSTHPPIIDRALWDRVHELMITRARRTGKPSQPSSLTFFPLKGRVFGEDGRRMTPWVSSKQRGGHFLYYIPQKEISVGAGASGLPRVSAFQLHAQVYEHLRENFRDPSEWLGRLPPGPRNHPTFDKNFITQCLVRLDEIWDLLWPREQTRILRLLVHQVIIGPNDFTVRVSIEGVFNLIFELALDGFNDAQITAGQKDPPAG